MLNSSIRSKCLWYSFYNSYSTGTTSFDIYSSSSSMCVPFRTLVIFSAKFDCLLFVLSRPAFSVLLKNLPFRPAESVFFAPSLAGLLVNLRAEKINLLAKDVRPKGNK